VFSRPFASRWNFDVEIIARYLHEGGASNGIYEEPVPRWTDTGDSKVRPLDFVRAIGEMAHLYQAYPLGQPLRPLVSALTSVFSRYAFMGAVGTLLHYATLVTLVEVLRATPTFGAVVGASVGALANYVLNYHLTFASQRAHQRTFPRFVVVALLGVAISGYGVKAATTLGVSYLLAQVACTIVVLGVGYVLNRLWTFAA
jgi:putative flippase GtrA